jgi:hypothetical protein
MIVTTRNQNKIKRSSIDDELRCFQKKKSRVVLVSYIKMVSIQLLEL